MSTYELPSIYNQKQRSTQYFQGGGDDDLDLHDGLHDQTQPIVLSPDQQLVNRETNDSRLVCLLLITPLAMLIFTLIPVVTDLPAVSSMTSGDAIWRLFDPVCLVIHDPFPGLSHPLFSSLRCPSTCSSCSISGQALPVVSNSRYKT